MALITPGSAAQLLLARRNARRSMIDYVKYLDLGFVPAAHHQLMCNKLDAVEQGDIKKLMLFLPPGSGKALALYTMIPTPTGWTTMGDLKVGDRVFDESGNPCNVVWKSEVFCARPVYKLTTDCGDAIVADAKHEWLVSNGGGGTNHGRAPFKLQETHELAQVKSKRPMIQRAKALQLPELNLPIEPYLLGLWLGDGSSQSMIITASLDDQLFYREEFTRLEIETRNQSNPLQFSVIGQRAKFVALNLLNDPLHNTHGHKHIPRLYQRGSYEQRLSLLQGLIDSDGYVSKTQGSTTFYSTNYNLACDVQELVRTLGVKASLTEKEAYCEHKYCGQSYAVSFYLQGSARLPRKAELTRNQVRTPNAYIDAVPYGTADTACIEVDSASHLFLCGDSLLPTHNSKYGSELFPTYYLGKNPTKSILACSHTQPLADRFGRRTRNLFALPEHAALFGVTLARDSQAASYWSTSLDGEYFAAGVGVAISGRRADLGLIDDPVKGHEDADSESKQASNWEWYLSDFLPRLKPNAAQVIIQTRWSEGDLAGRILEREAAEWNVVELAMEADVDDALGRKVGERLWPEWFTADQVEVAKRDARSWSALYQQRPVAEEGEYFHRDWFPEFEHIPDNANYYGASDYAVTSYRTADFTEHGMFALDSFGNLYIVDWWRGQTESEVWVDKQCDLIQEYLPLLWFGEKGVIQRAVEPYLALRMTERNAGCRLEWLPSIVKKELRLRSFQALASRGKVFLPKNAGWKGELLQQLTHFPVGRHDDSVDVCSLIGRGLDQVAAPRMKKWTRNESRDTLREVDAFTWMSS